MREISSGFLIREFFRSEIRLYDVNRKNLLMRESRHLHRSISHRVRQVDTMKRKQFVKGINQIAQEGAIQIFQEYNTGMEEIIVGVVGVLQFDVLKYRLEQRV